MVENWRYLKVGWKRDLMLYNIRVQRCKKGVAGSRASANFHQQCLWGKIKKNGNLKWHLPWRGRGHKCGYFGESTQALGPLCL